MFNGVPYLIIFTFNIEGIIHTSFRRIFITNRSSPNLNNNPSITSLNLNGGIINKPNLGDLLSLSFTGIETYELMNVDGVLENRTEKLVTAWFISDGELDNSKTNAEDSIVYKSNPPMAKLLIISVLRDDRGGVDVLESFL
jgi:hypothetical protein